MVVGQLYWRVLLGDPTNPQLIGFGNLADGSSKVLRAYLGSIDGFTMEIPDEKPLRLCAKDRVVPKPFAFPPKLLMSGWLTGCLRCFTARLFVGVQMLTIDLLCALYWL